MSAGVTPARSMWKKVLLVGDSLTQVQCMATITSYSKLDMLDFWKGQKRIKKNER